VASVQGVIFRMVSSGDLTQAGVSPVTSLTFWTMMRVSYIQCSAVQDRKAKELTLLSPER
jgi:hypothetical protein